jgi:hypothetical protein
VNSGFLDKLIERIGRVRPEDVQSYLLRLADERGFLETIFNAIQEGVIVTGSRRQDQLPEPRRLRDFRAGTGRPVLASH